MIELKDIQKRFAYDKEESKRTPIELRKKIKEHYKKYRNFEKTAKKFKVSRGIVYFSCRKVLQLIRNKQIEIYKKKLESLSQFQIGYIVGILEGEGFLGILKSRERLRIAIAVSNRDIKIVQYFNKYVGLPISLHSFRNYKRKPHKNKKYNTYGLIYEWKCNDKRLLKPLLEKIYPYMIGKKKEIGILLEFLNLKDRGEQEKAYEKLQKIKAKKNNKIKLKDKVGVKVIKLEEDGK